MERLPNDSAEWMLLRRGAQSKVSMDHADECALDASRRLGPLPPLSEDEWGELERDLYDLESLTRCLEVMRSNAILRAARLHPDDRERAVHVTEAVQQRVDADFYLLRDKVRTAASLRERLTSVMAKSPEPEVAVRNVLLQIMQRLTA